MNDILDLQSLEGVLLVHYNVLVGVVAISRIEL
jgi:hypothetical protein